MEMSSVDLPDGIGSILPRKIQSLSVFLELQKEPVQWSEFVGETDWYVWQPSFLRVGKSTLAGDKEIFSISCPFDNYWLDNATLLYTCQQAFVEF